jgi:NAD-dependent deacetylase
MTADSQAAARQALADAEQVTVLTGAGASADSGIATFRDAEGHWENFRPEDLASPDGFRRDPAFVWSWYDARRGDVAAAESNAGHRALAELEARVPALTLVTQNVDGLHQRAGSRNVLELHGSLWALRCTACGAEGPDERVPLPEVPPHCGACGGLLRPAVVWFGEALPQDVLAEAFAAAEAADVFLVAGTSAAVQPAASLPLIAQEAGTTLIEVNAEETPLTAAADYPFLGRTADWLPALVPAD